MKLPNTKLPAFIDKLPLYIEKNSFSLKKVDLLNNKLAVHIEFDMFKNTPLGEYEKLVIGLDSLEYSADLHKIVPLNKSSVITVKRTSFISTVLDAFNASFSVDGLSLFEPLKRNPYYSSSDFCFAFTVNSDSPLYEQITRIFARQNNFYMNRTPIQDIIRPVVSEFLLSAYYDITNLYAEIIQNSIPLATLDISVNKNDVETFKVKSAVYKDSSVAILLHYDEDNFPDSLADKLESSLSGIIRDHNEVFNVSSTVSDYLSTRSQTFLEIYNLLCSDEGLSVYYNDPSDVEIGYFFRKDVTLFDTISTPQEDSIFKKTDINYILDDSSQEKHTFVVGTGYISNIELLDINNQMNPHTQSDCMFELLSVLEPA